MEINWRPTRGRVSFYRAGAVERMTDGGTVARGAAITLGGQLAKFVVQGAGLVVLSRLLPPEDYGRYVMILAIVGVAVVVADFGLSLAAIQASDLSREQSSNLFWLNSLLGFMAGFLVFVSAPLIAVVFDDTTLEPATRALSAIFLLSSMAAQYRAELNRGLRFVSLAAAEVASQVIGLALAVALALYSPSLWVLVTQQISAAASFLLVAATLSRWLPRLPSRKVSIREFLSFGAATTATQALNYISSNVDSIVIGRLWGAGPLGVYNRAFQIFMLPLQQLASPMTRVVLPVLAQVRLEERYTRYLERGQLVLCYLLLPWLAFVAAAATPLMVVILGPRWGSGGPILQGLAIGGVFQVLGYVYYWTFLSQAKMNVLLACEAVGRSFLVLFVVLAANLGVVWVAWAYALGLCLTWLITGIFGMPRTGVSALRLIRVGLPPLWLGGSIFLGVWTMNRTLGNAGLPAVLLLAILALTGVVLMAISMASPRFRRDIRIIVGFVKSANSGRGTVIDCPTLLS